MFGDQAKRILKLGGVKKLFTLQHNTTRLDSLCMFLNASFKAAEVSPSYFQVSVPAGYDLRPFWISHF